MSHPESSSPIDLNKLKKSRYRFNVIMVLLYLGVILMILTFPLYSWVDGIGWERGCTIALGLNAGIGIIASIFYLVAIYMVFSLTWDLHFSKGGVLGYVVLMFLGFQGSEGNGLVIFFPFGPLYVWIALYFYVSDALASSTNNFKPDEPTVPIQSEKPQRFFKKSRVVFRPIIPAEILERIGNRESIEKQNEI